MAKRGRPKKVKEVKAVEPVKEPEKQEETPEIKDNSGPVAKEGLRLLAEESDKYVSPDEAARILGISEACARLYFDHHIFTGRNDLGFIRINRKSLFTDRVQMLLTNRHKG